MRASPTSTKSRATRRRTSSPSERPAPRVAVSAFEPFGGRGVNRSLALLRRLERLRPIEAHVLPVAFGPLPAAVRAIAATRPTCWLLLGESSLATGLQFEQRAWNRIQARIPDNLGAQPKGVRVARGPRLRRTELDLAPLLAAARERGASANSSADAGRFACNAAYFVALGARPARRVLFVHVPTDPRYGSDATLARGLAAVIDALLAAVAGRSDSRR